MHVVKSKKNIIMPPQYYLYAGAEYLVDDVNVALFTQDADNDATITHWEETKFDPSKDWNDKKILIIRAGGFGDILFMTPIIKELKRRWADCKISICTRPQYMAIAENNPKIESCYEYPMRLGDNFDIIVSLEHLLESQKSRHKNAVELVFEKFGMDSEDKEFELILSEQEKEWAAALYPRLNKPRIAVQASCTSKIRSYPPKLMSPLVEALAFNDIEVYLIGEPEQIKVDYAKDAMRNIVNLSLKSYSYRESLSVCKTCDIFIGVDSGLTYGLSAIGLPCIAVYGSYPSKFRAKYQKNIHVLENAAPCAPCFARYGFPTNTICSKTEQCEVIASVHPQQIIAKIKELLPSVYKK